MTWEEYYERFYDWAGSTQISRISKLTSFGSSEEVAEVAVVLSDEAAASRLIKKAVAAGVTFSAEEILDMIPAISQEAMDCAVTASKCIFTKEQLEDLSCAVSDDVLEAACRRSKISLFAEEDESEESDIEEFFAQAPQPKLGFFTTLTLMLGISSLFGRKPGKHPGRCDGDCAHCPPHYGYRYGRWYYGHHHQYGCELGGNKER